MEKMRGCFDKIRGFFASGFFNARYITKVHILQFALVIVMIIMTGARIATKPEGVPTTRSDTIGIVMGVKTIVVLIYQLLSSHVQRFQRWASVKAYAILNTLEILFWFVVVILTLMGVSRLCTGVSCGLSWVCILIAVVLCLLAAWTSVVSIKNWRLSKKMGNHDYAGNHDYGHGLPK